VALKKGQTQMVMATEKISNGRVVVSAKCKEDDPWIKAALTGVVTIEVTPVNSSKSSEDGTPRK